MATEILSALEYKERRGLHQDLDPEVVSFIAAANALILKQLNWQVEENGAEFIEILKGRDRYFINNLSATKIKSLTLLTDSSTNHADKCYILDSGRLYISKSLAPGMYKIEYDAESTTWPEDLKLAVALTVEYWEKQEYRNAKSFGGESVTFMSQTVGLPKHVMTIVNSNRII